MTVIHLLHRTCYISIWYILFRTESSEPVFMNVLSLTKQKERLIETLQDKRENDYLTSFRKYYKHLEITKYKLRLETL